MIFGAAEINGHAFQIPGVFSAALFSIAFRSAESAGDENR